MKLCTFEIKTPLGRYNRLGTMLNESILDLNFAAAYYLSRMGEAVPYQFANAIIPSDMLSFLQTEKTGMKFANETIEFFKQEFQGKNIPSGLNEETLAYQAKDVRLRAPLPNPTSFRDFYAFEQHVKKGFEKRGEAMPQEWYEIPVYYKGNHNSIIGTDENVWIPSFTEKFDYELELGFVIGKLGRNIPEQDAMNHIAGFTVLNDFSARDMQRKEMKVRLGPAKGKDFATAIGPVLVSTDEIGDVYNLKMTAKVNGEVWSEGNTGTIFHKFEKMIAFASMDETLLPGDLFGSGTVGTGCGLELDKWVKSGDILELEIEKIGILRNQILKKSI
ncbi:MAG: fumarylacetoacetate hydrolase family protein [Ignavibacteriales bacterium]|nr:fumarylacetoacetate hydrolase family protein [Ignavibacteriales bacterium]